MTPFPDHALWRKRLSTDGVPSQYAAMGRQESQHRCSTCCRQWKTRMHTCSRLQHATWGGGGRWNHLLKQGLVPLGVAVQVRHELLPRRAHQVLGEGQMPDKAQSILVLTSRDVCHTLAFPAIVYRACCKSDYAARWWTHCRAENHLMAA